MNLDALKHLSILYVEDEALIRQNAVEYLARYCHTVYEAKDGVEGLEMYHAHKPDIIISDINMPRLSGLDFASKVRKLDKSTPIILATAHTQTAYLLKAVELQLIKYLVKPITSDKLNEALNMACNTLTQKTEHHIKLDSVTRYDALNKTLFIEDTLVKFTHNEQKFFELLITHHQRAVTYEEIESSIWAYEGMSMDALRSLVRGLRQKLQGEYVENISGLGYRLAII
jgi:DNA-binding response OmpR family regulator